MTILHWLSDASISKPEPFQTSGMLFQKHQRAKCHILFYPVTPEQRSATILMPTFQHRYHVIINSVLYVKFVNYHNYHVLMFLCMPRDLQCAHCTCDYKLILVNL